MKKTVYLCATALMLAAVSCGGGQSGQSSDNQAQNQEQKQEENVQKQSKAFPWDYPEGIKGPGLEDGCHALVPSNVYVTAENPADEMYVFTEVTIKKVGDKASVFQGDGIMNVELPNSLIIPLSKNQTAKVGDVVITWNQSGWDCLRRAIVTDATNPAQPKVAYLDVNWDDAQKQLDEQLEAGSFTVLKSNEWQPGQSVVYDLDGHDEILIVVSVSDTKVLANRFDGKIHVLDRSKCTLIPTDAQFKVGDKVRGQAFGMISDGFKVKRVDARNGRLWFDDVLGETNMTILEVLK